jgi:farnesyl-diphosphate farnesyltransferase
MAIDVPLKVRELRSFHEKLYIDGWNSRQGWGKEAPFEEQLLNDFQRVVACFKALKPAYQHAIADICKRMGDGMADYIELSAKNQLQGGVDTIADYNQYCHYVAGLVGIGLTRLFHSSGLEGDRFKNVDALANSMGLFLQKTNITRDYLEDINENPPRIFYPKEIWKNYTDDIANFKSKKYEQDALYCLNDMVTNALGHLPDVIAYLELIQEPSVFRFCAIPQIMAIATLEVCYNNREVFRREVKITKLDAIKLIMQSNTHRQVYTNFLSYIAMLRRRVPPNDPSARE